MSFMNIWRQTEGIPETQTDLVTYNLCSDGLYMTKKIAGGGLVTLKIDETKYKEGLPEGYERIDFLKRKIPYMYLIGALNFMNHAAEKVGHQVEIYVIIAYSNAEDKYKIWVPEHMVSPGSVDYDISKFSEENPGYHIVMDLHSHTGFGAFFSSTDDGDDIRDRFSGVLGHISSWETLETKFRFSANGRHWDYDIEDLFENVDTSWNDVAFSWEEGLSKISKRKNKPFRVMGNKNGSK